jgi:hypothetical protein
MRRPGPRLLPLPWLLPLAAACAGGTDGDTASAIDSAAAEDPPVLVSLAVIPDELTLATTRSGGVVSAIATWSDDSEVEVTGECAWSWSDYGVATIDNNGAVKGLGVGTAVGTCTVDTSTADVTVTVSGVSPPVVGDLAVNEVLVDVPEGVDVNGDGVADAPQEQFVELVNRSSWTVDLDGATLWVKGVDTPRHTFGTGVLMPGEAVVLFGGGTPSFAVDRCAAFPVYNSDPLEAPLGLALTPLRGALRLVDAAGNDLAAATWDGDYIEKSMVLDPEIDGVDYVEHADIPDAPGAWSPCTRVAGEPFPTPEERLGE